MTGAAQQSGTFSGEWNPADEVGTLARRLVAIHSETGTPGEAAFAPQLAAILRELPYFRENPGDIRLADSHGSPTTQNVVAVVRGHGRQALFLAGHYDTGSFTVPQFLWNSPNRPGLKAKFNRCPPISR